MPPKDLAVFTTANPRPADALTAIGLKQFLIRVSEQELDRLRPTDAKKLAESRRVVGTALQHMIDSAPR